MNYEIYLIINLINGKRYVGQVNSGKGYLKRFKEHCYESFRNSKSNCALHNAIKKYGEDNFIIKRLLHNIPVELIDYYETLWILKLHSHTRENGYNETYGGQGIHGYKHTDSTKRKLSRKSIEYWQNLKSGNPEEYIKQCQIRSTNLKGKAKSLLHRKRLSEACKKRYEIMENPFKNKHHSEESKKLISLANGNKVGMYDKNTFQLIRTFNSAMEATKYLIDEGITTNKTANTRILKICHGIDKSAYGYIWKFL